MVAASSAFTALAMRVASSYANWSLTTARIVVCCMTLRDPARGHDLVVDLDVSVDEDSIPGHFDVVEDHERVLLVEAARERVIEPSPGQREAVATQHLHARVCSSAPRRRARTALRPSGMGCPGYTRSSSANGASVASTRAPRTMMPCSVSSALCSATAPFARVDLGHALVDRRVDDRVRECQVATRTAHDGTRRGSLRPPRCPSAPHTSVRPANPATVTLR